MKVVSTEALTKLIQLVKSAFIKVDDTVETQTVDVYSKSEIDANNYATSTDLSNKIQKVSTEPVSYDTGVLYVIPE